MKSEKQRLVFVYNADSGVFNLLSDIAHKIFSPQTYSCNLCAITHSKFGMKDEWRKYLGTLKIPFQFLHADEFKEKYKIKNNEKLPTIFLKNNGRLETIVDAAALNSCRSINELKQLIDKEISQL